MTLLQNHVRPITIANVIWSQISKLFHRNDHHIEATSRAQHLGRYLEGQGLTMTLQQNRVRPITLLFEVGFYNFFWQTTSLCPIHIRGALPGSDRLLFLISYVYTCKLLFYAEILKFKRNEQRTELVNFLSGEKGLFSTRLLSCFLFCTNVQFVSLLFKKSNVIRFLRLLLQVRQTLWDCT